MENLVIFFNIHDWRNSRTTMLRNHWSLFQLWPLLTTVIVIVLFFREAIFAAQKIRFGGIRAEFNTCSLVKDGFTWTPEISPPRRGTIFKKKVDTWDKYHSSQNHGSGKGVPPILVSFHLGWFSFGVVSFHYYALVLLESKTLRSADFVKQIETPFSNVKVEPWRDIPFNCTTWLKKGNPYLFHGFWNSL